MQLCIVWRKNALRMHQECPQFREESIKFRQVSASFAKFRQVSHVLTHYGSPSAPQARPARGGTARMPTPGGWRSWHSWHSWHPWHSSAGATRPIPPHATTCCVPSRFYHKQASCPARERQERQLPGVGALGALGALDSVFCHNPSAHPTIYEDAMQFRTVWHGNAPSFALPILTEGANRAFDSAGPSGVRKTDNRRRLRRRLNEATAKRGDG
jgi:hypothetical protein